MASHCFGFQFDMNGAEVGSIVDFDGPEPQVTSSNATHLKSTNARKEFLPGFVDEGEPSFTLRFDKDQHATLRALLRQVVECVITLPDGSTITFQGFITSGPGIKVPEDGAIDSPMKVKITGEVTYAAAA